MSIKSLAFLPSLRSGPGRDLAMAGLGAVAVFIAFLLLGQRYELAAAGGEFSVAYRLDRWTGAIARCNAGCLTGADRQAQPKPLPDDWIKPSK